jgi:hypothetical protein
MALARLQERCWWARLHLLWQSQGRNVSSTQGMLVLAIDWCFIDNVWWGEKASSSEWKLHFARLIGLSLLYTSDQFEILAVKHHLLQNHSSLPWPNFHCTEYPTHPATQCNWFHNLYAACRTDNYQRLCNYQTIVFQCTFSSPVLPILQSFRTSIPQH